MMAKSTPMLYALYQVQPTRMITKTIPERVRFKKFDFTKNEKISVILIIPDGICHPFAGEK
jgi:hypothetical protein